MSGSQGRADHPDQERFERRERLGAGASGEVWAAWDRELRRPVALKTLRSPSPRSLLRFKREFRALADLSHRNLVELLGLVIDEHGWHIAMELVHGVPLLDFLRGTSSSAVPDRSGTRSVGAGSRTHDAGEPWSLPDLSLSGDPMAVEALGGEPQAPLGEEALSRLYDTVGQLVEALRVIHDLGILHRDVKPSNVLVEPGGRVVVLDFGLLIEPEDRAAGGFAGTPAYASPEQLAGAPVDESSDLYAVGVILFEALTGRLPFSFDGDLASIALRKRQFDAPDPRLLVPGAPPELLDLTRRLLSREPRERPGVAAVLRALRREPGEGGGSLFVGREQALARLNGALARTRFGSFEARWLLGPSGVGKSALARRFASLAQKGGAWALEGRCYAADRVGFRGFDAIVDGLARRLQRLPPPEVEALLGDDRAPLARLFPVLGGSSVTSMGPLDFRQVRAQAFEALRAVLGRLAERYPVVLVLDDAQWLDPDGRELLAALAEEPAPAVLVLATARSEAEEELRGLVPRGQAEEVGPLTLQETRALLAGLARLEEAGEPLAALAEEVAGEPLLARELWRSRSRGQTIAEALRARVAGLTVGATEALRVLAVAGRPLRSDVVEEAAGLGEEGGQALRELRRQRLLRGAEARGQEALELFHDRLREVLLSDLGPFQQREIHRRIAGALLARGAVQTDPAGLLLHLERSGEGARAVELALDAARRAREALAFERAVELARAGLALGPGRVEARALREELSRALVGAGRGCEAARLLEERAADEGAEGQAALLQGAAEQWLTSGELGPGFAALRGALGGEDPLRQGRPALLLRLLGAKGRAWALERAPGLPRWLRRSSERRSLERELDAVRTVAFGLGMIDNLRAAAYHARALELALLLGDPRRLGEVLATEAIFRGSLGTPERHAARALLARARRIAPMDEGVEAWAQAAEAVLATFEAPTESSIATLERCEQAFHGGIRAAGWARSSLFLVRSLSRRMAGDFVALRRDVRARIRDAEARGDRYLAVSLRRGASILWLAAGDPAGLRDELACCRWPGPEQGVHIQHWMELDAEGELALYEGEIAGALARFRRERLQGRVLLLSRLQRVRTLLAGLEGRLLAAQGAEGAAARRIAALALALDREQVAHARVQAALLRAALACRAGDRGALRGQLSLAILLAEASGLQAHAACASRRWQQSDLGPLPGSEPDLFFQAQRVREPDRLVALYAPGLDPR